MQRVMAAENSDLFDVLAYVAFALPPQTRLSPRSAGLGSGKGSTATSRKRLSSLCWAIT